MNHGLIINHSGYTLEVGCDEAGRGCLAGPVFAAAVILPSDFRCELLNDSKKVNDKNRLIVRKIIEEQALFFAVASMSPAQIDKYNILWASVRTMHKAIDKLGVVPEYILVDGNKFIPYHTVPHTCMIGGDARYMSIAAASILAKTYRDDYMIKMSKKYPDYGWAKNKGYPTQAHRAAIASCGPTPLHRKTFKWLKD